MDPFGAALLSGTYAVEHNSKQAHVNDSPEAVLKDARIKIMGGQTVASVLQQVAKNHPEELANKVASEIKPCDHVLGIMWADSKLFKNASDLKTFIQKRPHIRIIMMEKTPHGSYWKHSAAHRDIPRMLFNRFVVKDTEPLKRAFSEPGFFHSLVDQGVLSKGAAIAFIEQTRKKDASLVKIAAVLETMVKRKKATKYASSNIGIDMEQSELDIDISQPADMKTASIDNDVFYTVGDPEINLDLIGVRDK